MGDRARQGHASARARSEGASVARKRDAVRVRTRANARRRGQAVGCLRPAVASVGGARHGMRCGRLLQLRDSDKDDGSEAALRACVPRGPGFSRQRDQLVMDLSVHIGTLTLKSPLIAASGCFGYGTEYAELVDLSSLGGVAVKGLF